VQAVAAGMEGQEAGQLPGQLGIDQQP